MRNLHDIFDCYFSEPQRLIVLATLFSVSGSHVYRPGALLALAEDGAVFGSISAGCLEDDIRLHAQSLFAHGGSKMISYGPEEVTDSVFGLGLGCGGGVQVLLELLPTNRESSHLCQLKRVLAKRNECVSVALWKRGEKLSTKAPRRAIISDGKCVFETIHDEVTLSYLLENASTLLAGSDGNARNLQDLEANCEALMTLHKPQLALTVYGSGEIANALFALGRTLQWNITIVTAKLALSSVESESQYASAAVLLTHNDALEAKLLRKLLPSTVAYVGMLGSRSRIGRVVTELEQAHPEWTNEGWEKLHAPVGLDIGSESPPEIALSIVSEIVAVFNRHNQETLGRITASICQGVKTIHPRFKALSDVL